MGDHEFRSGAVRSTDADHLDFMSMPLLGLLGVARNSDYGGKRYGRFNYQLGMPASTHVNHAMTHLARWGMGDRSEDHLARAAWNCMAALQETILNPSGEADMPGPGYTLTPAILADLEANRNRLAALRRNGEGGDPSWHTADLPEVRKILEDRDRVLDHASVGEFEEMGLLIGPEEDDMA
jgi:hypothetical protein